MKPKSNIVLDTGVWLEYFRDAPSVVSVVQPAIEAGAIVVPSICIYEVALAVGKTNGSDDVLAAAAVMRSHTVDDLHAERAIQAAELRKQYRLPMADSIVYATTLAHSATLFTQDSDFEGLPNVHFLDPRRL
ncbi:MAG: type II toxin-antitoxin system VapC family toxin [bacterium]|nr:type II toxin-antitoxin system VapC family toxin [bacterium]